MTALKILKTVFSIGVASFFVGWPLLILASVKLGHLNWILWLSIVAFSLRILLLASQGIKDHLKEIIIAFLGVLLVAIALVTNQDVWFLWYPVMVNSVLLVYFAQSLAKGPSVIERLATLARRGKPLPLEGVIYTRNVTKVWCGFFIINGSIATWTILHGDLMIWSLWNGALSYVAIMALLGGEFAYRKWIKKVDE